MCCPSPVRSRWSRAAARVATPNRGAVRPSDEPEQARDGRALVAVTRVASFRTGLAAHAGREHHEVVAAGGEGLVIQAEPGHRARREVLEHHVSPGSHALRQIAAGRRLQVHGHAELGTVEVGVELGAVGPRQVVLERRPRSQEVEPLGRLDAHHGGAVVGECLADHGSDAHPTEVGDLESGESRAWRRAAAGGKGTRRGLGKFPEPRGRCSR